MNDETLNPRAVPGDNAPPDYARIITDQMARDYAPFRQAVRDALDEARKLPPSVEDEETASEYTAVIKRLRELNTRTDGFREAEKVRPLTECRAIDSFFFGIMEEIERRTKNGKPGASDDLQGRLHVYNQRRLAEERRVREEERRKAEAAERAAREEREAAERAARDAALKAERARKEESRAAAEKAEREAREKARVAREAEEAERARRQEADANARAKSAELVRERHGSGAMNTMRQVPYVEVVDRMLLDFEQLKPFFKDDHILMAVKGWAKTTQHKKQMAGAIIEMRDETVVL